MSDLLADFVPIGQFAKNVRKNIRTIYRWMDEPNGLPFSPIGNQRLIHIPTARTWIMSRMHQRNPDRRRRARK